MMVYQYFKIRDKVKVIVGIMFRKVFEIVVDVYDRLSIKKNCIKFVLWIIKNMLK